MQYITSLDGISPAMLNGFFVGWPKPPSAQKHYVLLQNSYKFVLAIDEKADKVVGFITAISDGVLSAYIPLLEVLPTYQKQGIGGKLIKLMLLELSDFYMVDLICDENLQDYYERFGLLKAKGMITRNFAYQAGRVR
ncbi:MAG: GNAT family N-acetyltransferase [Bacillota bacterium]